MTATCSRCGLKWPRDPALEVACPTCRAVVGVQCVRPSGHTLWGKGVHATRDNLALATVDGYDRCGHKSAEYDAYLRAAEAGEPHQDPRD
jgi:hypothetical protein